MPCKTTFTHFFVRKVTQQRPPRTSDPAERSFFQSFSEHPPPPPLPLVGGLSRSRSSRSCFRVSRAVPRRGRPDYTWRCFMFYRSVCVEFPYGDVLGFVESARRRCRRCRFSSKCRSSASVSLPSVPA